MPYILEYKVTSVGKVQKKNFKTREARQKYIEGLKSAGGKVVAVSSN